jgi:anti-sigma B factor antagonist
MGMLEQTVQEQEFAAQLHQWKRARRRFRLTLYSVPVWWTRPDSTGFQSRIARISSSDATFWWQDRKNPMAANPVTPNPELELDTERKDAKVVVHASGRITAATSAQLQSTIRGLIPDNKHVVLDLKNVHYIDSSGIGALVSVHLAAAKAQSALELANLQPRIRDLFELTRLTAVFENQGGYRGLTSD